MKAKFLAASVGLTTLVMAAGSVAFAGPLEQVNLDGSAGHATVASALAAVDDNGVVEIVEAGTYTGSINLSGGPANYTIRKAASVSGTVILTNGASGLVTMNDPGAPISFDKDVTIEGVRFERTGGTGTVIDIDQSNPVVNNFTITVTLNDCEVEHTASANGDSGEALKLDDGFVGGALVTFNANNTTFIANAEQAAQKAAIRVQDTTWENLNVNLDNCVVTSVDYRAIRNDGGSNQNWTITNATITGGPTEVAILLDDPHNNHTWLLQDTTITSGQECIKVEETNTGNRWTINRCTLQSTEGLDPTIRLRYTTTPNGLEVFNSVIIVAEGNTSSTHRGIHLSGVDEFFVYNNTFVGSGSGSAEAIGGTGVSANAWNNLCLNFLQANLLGGSYGGEFFGFDSDNNIIVGPSDDDSRGSGGAYIFAEAGLANAIAAAGLDADFRPLSGSAVIDAGGTINSEPASNNDILAAIGGVDRDSTTRDSMPDVGAFEFIEVTSNISDWMILH